MLVADSAPHEMRIEAPHHVTRHEALSLDQDSTLEIVLAEEPAVAAPRSTSPAVRAPTAPPRAAPGAKAEHGKRSLDGANPYEH